MSIRKIVILYKVGEKFDALAQMARDYKNYDEKTFTYSCLSKDDATKKRLTFGY